jgi:hypothetical protein
MKIDFVTPIKKKLIELDQITVLLLMADHYGLAHFPETGETVVSPLLVQGHWQDWCIQAHWIPVHGVGVGAVVNSVDDAMQRMDMQPAKNRKFETAFSEALEDPTWVATQAESARLAMLDEVDVAAWLMMRAWERALEIPATRPAQRWFATAIRL